MGPWPWPRDMRSLAFIAELFLNRSVAQATTAPCCQLLSLSSTSVLMRQLSISTQLTMQGLL